MKGSHIFLFLLTSILAESTTADEKIEIPIREDRSIQGVLRIPRGCPSTTRFPVILVFGGFVEAAIVLELLTLSEPVILASFDYPYRGDRKLGFPGVIFDAGNLRDAVRVTQEGITSLVSLLKNRKDVDPERIAIVGASFGAPFAIHAAAESPDLSALIVVHGFGDIRGTIRHRLLGIWADRLGRFSNFFAGLASWVITLILNPPIPEKDAMRLRTSQQVLLIEAKEDSFIPQRSKEVLWDALGDSAASVRRIEMPGEHLRPGSTELIEKLINTSLDWLNTTGWLPKNQKCLQP